MASRTSQNCRYNNEKKETYFARTHFSSIQWRWINETQLLKCKVTVLRWPSPCHRRYSCPVESIHGLALIARPWHAGTSRVGFLVFHRQRCGDEYFVCHISAHGRKRKLKCNFDVFFLIEPYLKRKIKRQIHKLPNCRKSLKNTTPTGWLVLMPAQCRLFSRTVWKLLLCVITYAQVNLKLLCHYLFCLVHITSRDPLPLLTQSVTEERNSLTQLKQYPLLWY